jgi:hypothetical protein
VGGKKDAPKKTFWKSLALIVSAPILLSAERAKN